MHSRLIMYMNIFAYLEVCERPMGFDETFSYDGIGTRICHTLTNTKQINHALPEIILKGPKSRSK